MGWEYHEDGATPHQPTVFVFGSNLAGRHGKGAALCASKNFGAMQGRGIGPTGCAYAIPTKDAKLQVLPLSDIERHVRVFLMYAAINQQKRFWLTRVGCGLAGYQDEQIAPMFRSATLNVSMPAPWYPILENT